MITVTEIQLIAVSLWFLWAVPLLILMGRVWDVMGDRKNAWEEFGRRTGLLFSGNNRVMVGGKDMMMGDYRGHRAKLEITEDMLEHSSATNHYTQMLMFFNTPFNGFLELKKEGVGSRLRKKLSIPEKEVEIGDENFDSHFIIKCGDPELLKAVLDPQMRLKLLRLRDWRFDWKGPQGRARILGGTDTTVNVLMELIEVLSEVTTRIENYQNPKSPAGAGQPTYNCRSCGGMLSYIDEYGRWYCHNCQEYV